MEATITNRRSVSVQTNESQCCIGEFKENKERSRSSRAHCLDGSENEGVKDFTKRKRYSCFIFSKMSNVLMFDLRMMYVFYSHFLEQFFSPVFAYELCVPSSVAPNSSPRFVNDGVKNTFE